LEEEMIKNKEQFDTWCRHVHAMADMLERIKADPLQHISDVEIENMLEDLLIELKIIVGGS
jgi:hypothetical protein